MSNKNYLGNDFGWISVRNLVNFDLAVFMYNAGINLTGYHPPRAPRGFCTEMCARPGAVAQQKMPGGRANKG